MPKSLVSIFAKQYVAGESIDDVLNIVQKINASGFKTTIDILGEHFNDETEINNINYFSEPLWGVLSFVVWVTLNNLA